MSLYPSLEDMKVDELMQSQVSYMQNYASKQQSHSTSNAVKHNFQPSAPLDLPVSSYNHLNGVYPQLGEYMGLEFSQEVIASNMPEYLSGLKFEDSKVVAPKKNYYGVIAPLTGDSKGFQAAQVTGQIRKVILCKDRDGKFGLRISTINKGVFINLVQRDSAAALVGLRFGDQILQINDQDVAGFSVQKVLKILKDCPVEGTSIVVRDRPFERVVTLHKDSYNMIGFQFKNGKITAIVKDSSAAHNGLLIDHQLLEVNGQNVIGLPDKEITHVIENTPSPVIVTIVPTFIYDHMIKKLGNLKKLMDHSVPDI